jgi:hypothetical protein
MKEKFFVLVLLLVANFFSQPATAQTHLNASAVGLTVSVFNDAGVPTAVLSVAHDRAIYILSRARVSLTWIDCGTPLHRPPEDAGCSAISFPQHVSIRLVASASPVTQDTFGQSIQNAAGEGDYAVVYYRALESSNAAGRIRIGELLGHVVAHELGHLLLGADSHSATGLMSPVWQICELRQASRGSLFFTADQAKRMHTRYLAASARLKKTSDLLQASSGR